MFQFQLIVSQVVAEFDAEDQGRFIKFVTSVSKPPLLGFQYLRPAFTVRYVPVDVADQEEEGFSFKHLFMVSAGYVHACTHTPLTLDSMTDS